MLRIALKIVLEEMIITFNERLCFVDIGGLENGAMQNVHTKCLFILKYLGLWYLVNH
jgi:hypothetical protein